MAGGLWSAFARIIPQVYTLVILVAAAHYLGPARLGRQSYIAFIELTVVMLATAGMPIAVMRFVSESLGRGHPGAVRALIRWAWQIEIAAAILGGGGVVAIGLAGANPQGAWVLAGMAAALGVVHTVPSALLIGAQQWRAASIVGLTTGAAGTVAVVAALAAGGGITSMFAVEVVVSALNLVWTSALARRAAAELTTQIEPVGPLRNQTLRYALLSSTSVLMTFVVWRRSEFFFLDHYSTNTQIALYSISYSLVGAMVQLFEALTAVLTPAIATLYGAGEHERIRLGYGRALRLLLLLSLPLTTVMVSLGPAVLRLLGKEYRGTATVTVIMLATFPFVPLARAAYALLHGLGRVRFAIAAGTIATVANIVLDFLIIPGHAAVGAAIANGGAQAIAAVPALVYSIRATGRVDWQPRFIARGLVLAVLVGATAAAATHLAGGVLGIVAGSVAALAAVGVFGPILKFIPPDDAAWLQAMLAGRMRGIPVRVLRRWAPRVASETVPSGGAS